MICVNYGTFRVRVCVRACVRACARVRLCVCVCVRVCIGERGRGEGSSVHGDRKFDYELA